jgi:hypothetical protein
MPTAFRGAVCCDNYDSSTRNKGPTRIAFVERNFCEGHFERSGSR